MCNRYLINKKIENKQSKKWRENNKNRRNELRKRRRVIEKKAKGSHTFIQWNTIKKRYNWTCPCCKKKEPEITLTEDHVIPLSKGGSDNIENIQPLCRSCNSKKHTKIIKYQYGE